MYKRIFLSIICALLGVGGVMAQYTSGGSSKRYDEITRVTYDTIWTENKIELPVGPQFGQRLAFGLISMNSEFKDKMDKSAYFARPEYGAPLATGQMGGKGGMFFEYGLYDPVNMINKNLVPQLDFAFYYNIDAGFMKYDLSYLEGYFTSGSVQEELVSDFYGNKWFYGIGFGPMLTVNISEEHKFYLDVVGQLKFSMSSPLYVYNYASTYDPQTYNYTDYTLSIDTYESGFDINSVIGVNLRKDKFYLGVQRNAGFRDVRFYTESFAVDYYSSSSQAILSDINLSHTRLALGFHF